MFGGPTLGRTGARKKHESSTPQEAWFSNIFSLLLLLFFPCSPDQSSSRYSGGVSFAFVIGSSNRLYNMATIQMNILTIHECLNCFSIISREHGMGGNTCFNTTTFGKGWADQTGKATPNQSIGQPGSRVLGVLKAETDILRCISFAAGEFKKRTPWESRRSCDRVCTRCSDVFVFFSAASCLCAIWVFFRA